MKKKEEKDNKKKIIISSICGAILIILIGIATILLFNKPTEEKAPKKESKNWKTILNEEAKNGKLSKKLKDKLKDFKLETEKVELLLLDIDSDKDMELIAYAENKEDNNNKIFTFEIDKSVQFSKDYDVNSREDISYVYDMSDKNCYWYINSNGKKVIVTIEDKELTQEEFDNNYYVVTNKYNEKNIFDEAVEVKVDDKKIDISKELDKIIEKNITNEEILINNSLDKNKIEQLIADKKLEEEQAKKEAEEEKKRLEEEQRKNEQTSTPAASTSFKVGDYNVKFGKYKWLTPDGTTTFYYTLNSDYTCIFTDGDGKTTACNYSVGTATDGQDISSAVERPAIIIKDEYTRSYFPTSDGFRDTDLEYFEYIGN